MIDQHALVDVKGRADKYNVVRKISYVCVCGENFSSLIEFRNHSYHR